MSDGIIASGGFIRDYFESITLAGFNENVKGYHKDLFEGIVIGAFRENAVDYGRLLFESIVALETPPFETNPITITTDGRPRRTDNPDGGWLWPMPQMGIAVIVVGLGILTIIGAYREYKGARPDSRYMYRGKRERTREKKRRKDLVSRQKRVKKGDDLVTLKNIGRVLGLTAASVKIVTIALINTIKKSRIIEVLRSADKFTKKQRKRFKREKKAREKAAKKRREQYEKEAKRKESRR